MKRYAGALSLLILFLFCHVKESHAQYETATVFGRLVIKNPVHGQYKKHKRLHFSGKFDKTYSKRIKTKDSGFFSMKLPLGYSYLEKIVYTDGGEFLKKFPSDYLEIKLDSADRIYYIGDLELTWDILVTEERPENLGAGGGLLGAVIGGAIQKNKEGKIPVQALPIRVSMNPETIDRFSRKLEIAPESFLSAPVSVNTRP